MGRLLESLSKSGAGAARIVKRALTACSNLTFACNYAAVRLPLDARPRALNCGKNEEAKTKNARGTLKRPYRASRRAFRSPGGKFCKRPSKRVQRRLGWRVLTDFEPQLLQNCARGHPRTTAVPQQNHPAAISAEARATATCSPKGLLSQSPKASNRSLA